MRPALLAGLVVAVAPTVGFAQTGPYTAVVTDPEVRLRAGPSDQFPETAKLPKGASLVVDHEESNGWLAVLDPVGRVYSMSWVQMQFVDFDPTKRAPQNVVVTEDATLRPGQLGTNQPMVHIQKVKVPAGSILTVIGEKVTFEGKTWYPVAQSAGDFRYLPKQAVKFEKPANATFAVRDVTPPSAVSPAGGTAPVASIPGGASPSLPATPVGKPGVQHPLWAQAEAAERDGKYDEAERLLFQLAGVMNKEPNGDHDIANLCYTRIHNLREKKRTGGGGTSVATRPTGGEPTRPAVGTQTSGGSIPPAAEPRDDRARWTGPGRLVKSALALDGRRTYALESNPGVTVYYVVPAQGVDLERYVGKKVDVAGVSHTRAGLSKPYVVATAVELAQ